MLRPGTAHGSLPRPLGGVEHPHGVEAYGESHGGFPLLAHYLKTARHFGALNVQVSTQSKILAL
jgi:hypothetical protein